MIAVSPRVIARGFIDAARRSSVDSQSSVDSVKFVQVSIHTDAGVTGHGLNGNYFKGPKAAQMMIDECYAPAIVGRPAVDLPIAVGETVYTLHAFRDDVDCKGADIRQADVTNLSGIEEWLDVAALGRAHGLAVIPHTNVQYGKLADAVLAKQRVA
jgi:L-alanine-DL-glutamate epimerase-like enolase superfamily enzyme